MKQKSNNKIYYPNLILVITGIIIILFSVYGIFSLGMIKEPKASVLNTLKNEYYVVGKDPTPYQKEVFETLTKKLNEKDKDYAEIAELVSRSFVIDFFGWSNKDSAYDIGGLQYMYDPESFSHAAHWKYYQKVDVFNSTYGEGKLPKVKDIKASNAVSGNFAIDDEVYDAYKVSLSWDYDNRTNLNIDEFVNSSDITLIKDDGKISIVEVKMVSQVNDDE